MNAMKRVSILFTLIVSLIFLLSSCATSPPLAPEKIKKMAQEGIVVVEDNESKPHFSFVGTTVFNNRYEVLSDSETSFADYMVSRLKAKGYKASKSESRKHPRVLLLNATHPYQKKNMTGVGFYRRSFLGVSSPVMAFCNFTATLVDNQSKSSKSQPVFGTEYYFGRTLVRRAVKSWSGFTASEKNLMKGVLQNRMRAQADLIIAQLGL